MATVRTRREPPRFRQVEVRNVEQLTPRLRRVTFGGDELDGLVVEQPAASVRLLIPTPGTDALMVPTWTGNEFLLPGGARPTIRTFTPWRVRGDAREIDLGIVIHGTGAASEWARSVSIGAPAAISGPGRGYTVDPDARAFVLAGDETAIPAIAQLLETLPGAATTQVHIEIASSEAQFDLPTGAHAEVRWHEQAGTPGAAMAAAIEASDIDDDARVWVAGEAASVQRVRRHLFDERGIPRAKTTVRGYWKHGRSADTGDED